MTQVAEDIQDCIAEIALIARDVLGEPDAEMVGRRMARSYAELDDATQRLLLHEDPFHVAAEAFARAEHAEDYGRYVSLAGDLAWGRQRIQMRAALFGRQTPDTAAAEALLRAPAQIARP